MPELGIYRSNKNRKLYEVLMIALQKETNQELVIYRACSGDNSVYAKTLDEWNSTVEVNGVKKPRFEPYPPETETPTVTPETILSDYYGYDSFRPNQREIISNILARKDTLNILPTGAGKSICFQVPAMLMDGLTVVISPLVSLMTDQVTGLKLSGIPAEYYNSTLDESEKQRILAAIKEGLVKLLYIAPEQLNNHKTLSFLFSINVSMVVVDEAHCVSHWGHDFRSSYMKVKDFVGYFPKRPVVAAFTATATSKTASDMTALLNLKTPTITRASVDRPNLYYSVLRPESRPKKLLELIQARNGKAGIVYCATKKIATERFEKLKENGVSVALYHAGLSSQERFDNQKKFMNGDVDVIVATNAFGMGIDKPDVAFVIHYNMPKSLEEYYQEAGRAGRDGCSAECILLYSAEDIYIQNRLLEHGNGMPTDPVITQQLKEHKSRQLLEMIWYCTSPDCLRQRILTYFGEQADTHCGSCYNCDHTHDLFDVTKEAIIILRFISEVDGLFGSGKIIKALGGSKAKEIENTPKLVNNAMYGKLKEIKPHRIWLIINHLLSKGVLSYIERSGNYGQVFLLIKIANASEVESILNGAESVSIFLPEDTEQNVRTVPAEVNNELYEKLRKLKNQIAYEEHVPTYCVFSNATIQNMADICPTSLEEFARVSGVGKAKLNRYGQRFLNAIQKYNTEK